jgi:hypothetical protein
MRPVATASAQVRVPVAKATQVRESISMTFGGVPRVCWAPSTHCTAPNGGTRTSTVWPGIFSTRHCSRYRTAVAVSSREGSGSTHARTASRPRCMSIRGLATRQFCLTDAPPRGHKLRV